MIPPAFTRGLFRTAARPLPCVVAGVPVTLAPTEKNLGGNLGFRDVTKAQIVVGGCLVDATITTTITITGTKGLQ